MLYDLHRIPEELQRTNGWLWWVYGERNEKGKIPKFPTTIRKDPETGSTNQNNLFCLDSIEAILRTKPTGAGLGFSVHKTFPYTLVDLDDCFLPDGSLTWFARDVVDRLDSYTERSVSGNGLHIFVKGKVEHTIKHTREKWAGRKIEIYPRGTYVAITGFIFEGRDRIEDRQSELIALFEQELAADSGGKIEEAKPRTGHSAGYDESHEDWARLCEMKERTGFGRENLEKLISNLHRPLSKTWQTSRSYRERTLSRLYKGLEQK